MFIYPKYINYDDGSHLRQFAQNSNRRQQRITTQLLADLEIVVDKIHIKGHTDAWCKQLCDQKKHEHLDKVSIRVLYEKLMCLVQNLPYIYK